MKITEDLYKVGDRFLHKNTGDVWVLRAFTDSVNIALSTPNGFGYSDGYARTQEMFVPIPEAATEEQIEALRRLVGDFPG